MKVFSQKMMSLEEVESRGAHMLFITGAQTWKHLPVNVPERECMLICL